MHAQPPHTHPTPPLTNQISTQHIDRHAHLSLARLSPPMASGTRMSQAAHSTKTVPPPHPPRARANTAGAAQVVPESLHARRGGSHGLRGSGCGAPLRVLPAALCVTPFRHFGLSSRVGGLPALWPTRVSEQLVGEGGVLFYQALKACSAEEDRCEGRFSKHSQCPNSRAFAAHSWDARLESLCGVTLPWMSEAPAAHFFPI